ALLTERDPFRRSSDSVRRREATTAYESDVLERVLALERFAGAKPSASSWSDISSGAAKSVLRVARDLEVTVRADSRAADTTVRGDSRAPGGTDQSSSEEP